MHFHITDAGCDYTGLHALSDREEWANYHQHCMAKLDEICGLPARYALLGMRSCIGGLLTLDRQELIWRAESLACSGIQPVLVLPPVHQRFRREFLQFLNDVLCEGLWVAVQTDDIGCAMLISGLLPEGTAMYGGRCFDKTAREYRFDLSSRPELVRDFSVLTHCQLADAPYQEMFRTLGMSRVETDTLPDGKLMLPEGIIGWNILYPRIQLSRSAHCFYREHCHHGCGMYQKRFTRSDGKIFLSNERMITGCQLRPLRECISGSFRLIYAE